MQLVSIIVPIFNSELFIEKTISSMLEQTYENIEILLINDGSTDNSLSIMENYREKDSRIKIVTHENSGQSFTRNKGISMCKGDYLVFLDSDDWLDKRYIEKMYNQITNSNSDIVICDYTISYPNDQKSIVYNISENLCGDKSFELILDGKISHTCWGKMYKTSLIKDSEILFPVGRTNEDLYTVSIWFLKAKKVSFINELLITSRDREGSITNTFTKDFIDLLYILNLLKEFLQENQLLDKFKEQYITKYQKMVIYLANYGVRMKEINFIKKVLAVSEIPINEFNRDLLSTREKVAIGILKRSIKSYFLFIRLYYRFYAKEIHIKK